MPDILVSYPCGCVYFFEKDCDVKVKTWQHCPQHEKEFIQATKNETPP